jgi:hypothetical protein
MILHTALIMNTFAFSRVKLSDVMIAFMPRSFLKNHRIGPGTNRDLNVTCLEVFEGSHRSTQYALNKRTFCIEGSSQFFSMGSDVSKSPETLQQQRERSSSSHELLGKFKLGDYIEFFCEVDDVSEMYRGTVIRFDDWDIIVRLDPPNFEGRGRGEVCDVAKLTGRDSAEFCSLIDAFVLFR